MIKLLLPIFLAFTPIAKEEISEVESEAVEEVSESIEESIEEVSEEIESVQSEEEQEIEILNAVIDALKSEIESYKDKLSNETAKSIIDALLVFLASLGALVIKFKSFDKASLTLDDSKALLEVAKTEVKNLASDVKALSEELKTVKGTNEKLEKTTLEALNLVNKSVKRILEKLDTKEE